MTTLETCAEIIGNVFEFLADFTIFGVSLLLYIVGGTIFGLMIRFLKGKK